MPLSLSEAIKRLRLGDGVEYCTGAYPGQVAWLDRRVQSTVRVHVSSEAVAVVLNAIATNPHLLDLLGTNPQGSRVEDNTLTPKAYTKDEILKAAEQVIADTVWATGLPSDSHDQHIRFIAVVADVLENGPYV